MRVVARTQLVLDNHGPVGANLGRNDVSAEIADDDFTLGQFQVNTDCFCHQIKIFDEPRREVVLLMAPNRGRLDAV